MSSKLIIFSVFIFLIQCVSSANVVVDIDPDELQRIAEILVENYLLHNLSPTTTPMRNKFLMHVKKISGSFSQLCGITLSLVGANLITSWIQSSTPIINTQETAHKCQANYSSFNPSKICDKEFGCDRNICWRSCDDVHDGNKTLINTHSWCYTTPTHSSHTYQQCIYPHDCSPCWECLGGCHSKRKYWSVQINSK